MTEATLAVLLTVVANWANRRRLNEDQTTKAQSLAWYWANRHHTELPASHWARLAVRAVLNGRDLAGCGTGAADALSHMVQGAGMGEMADSSPPPDVLVAHAEAYEVTLGRLTERHRELADLKRQGASNTEVARTLGLSPGRASQLAREIWEAWQA